MEGIISYNVITSVDIICKKCLSLSQKGKFSLSATNQQTLIYVYRDHQLHFIKVYKLASIFLYKYELKQVRVSKYLL